MRAQRVKASKNRVYTGFTLFQIFIHYLFDNQILKKMTGLHKMAFFC